MKRSEAGATLILVLVTLAIMLIASVAMIKTTETSTAVAGNIAVKEAAVQAADLALGEAEAYIRALATPDASALPRYSAISLQSDAAGLPAGIDWTAVQATRQGNFTLQYVIDRQCDAPLPVSDRVAQCAVGKAEAQGSAKIGSPSYSALPPVYYRVTVRVTGPKNAETFVQGLYSY